MANGDKFDVVVVGAGPAGMMAAGIAAESGAKVILIEKNKQLGKKLLLTGNGRCNITNAEFNLKKLVENYGKDGKFLFHAFFVFGPKKTIEFFNSLGLKTKIEKNNRVFPANGNANDVLNAFKKYLLKNKVVISLSSPVQKVILRNNKIEKLIVNNKEITAEKYIFCAGGKSYPKTGSTGDGFGWAKEFGHNISELSPALTPIELKENWAKNLQGLALNNIKITALQNNKKYFQETGDILFAHFGLSGPAILNMSKGIGKLLQKGDVRLSLDLFPNFSEEYLNKIIQAKINKNPGKFIKSFLTDFMPRKLIEVFLNNLRVEPNRRINNVNKKERKLIAQLLKNIEITPIKLLDFDSAMITSGGVLLREIDDKTMRSKIINNLFFAGEIIDIDGKTGGFNLQACWSTGYLAGKNAANNKL